MPMLQSIKNFKKHGGKALKSTIIQSLIAVNGQTTYFQCQINHKSRLRTTVVCLKVASKSIICGSLFTCGSLFSIEYSEKHRVTTNTFYTEFSNYLETAALSKEPLLIMGDFNIHVDMAEDPDSIKFLDLIESFGLQQHMKHATHKSGHTLDLIITRHCVSIISAEPIPGQYLSDHLSTSCSLQIEKPSFVSKTVTYRKWKSVNTENLNRDLMESDLCQNTPDDLESLVACYNNTPKTTLDKHAPLKSKTVTIRPCVPWFSDKIKEAKRQKRKAEDKWRSSKLDADFAVFKLRRNEATNLMKQVRREFYANLVEENDDNQGKLFNICMQLFNRTNNMPTFPSGVDRSSFAIGLGNYFVQKITRIRQTLNENISNGSHVPNVCITNTDSTAMSTPTFNEFKGA